MRDQVAHFRLRGRFARNTTQIFAASSQTTFRETEF